MNKTERVIKAAEEHGWSHILDELEDGSTRMTLLRDQERMVITWDAGGSLQHPLTYWLHGLRELKLRNVSAALRQMAEKPNYKAGRRSRSTVDTDGEIVAKEALPFAMDDTDRDIIRAVRGKVVIWRNAMLETIEKGQVPDVRRVEVPDGKGGRKTVLRTSRNIYITTSSAGRRIITFPAVGEQFRSVGLDAIIAVR